MNNILDTVFSLTNYCRCDRVQSGSLVYRSTIWGYAYNFGCRECCDGLRFIPHFVCFRVCGPNQLIVLRSQIHESVNVEALRVNVVPGMDRLSVPNDDDEDFNNNVTFIDEFPISVNEFDVSYRYDVDSFLLRHVIPYVSNSQ